MRIHGGSRYLGSPKSFLDKNKANEECKCLMNIGGQCRKDSMQEYAQKLLKDGARDYVTECPYDPSFLMVSEIRIKSNLI